MSATTYAWNARVQPTVYNLYGNTNTGTGIFLMSSMTAPPPKVKHLKNIGTSNCCGANFLEWFPQPDAQGHIRKEILADVEQEIKAAIPLFNSMQLVILNSKQKPFYNDMLIEAGFKEIFDCNHPNHGNDLHLYAFRKYKAKHAADSRH